MFDFSGKVTLITGASYGLGEQFAYAFAEAGSDLILTARSEDALAMVAEKCRVKGRKVTAITGDVSVETDVLNVITRGIEEHDRVDVLINNAGIGKSAPFHRLDSSLWNDVIGLNLTGTFLCTQQVFSDMREAGYGRIVNISSTVGLRGYPYIAAYCASKHGVVGLTRTLALETIKKGITVNAICPGYTDTDLVSEAVDSIVDKTGKDRNEIQTEIDNMSPMGRMVDPEEVAEATAWICLPSSASITGQAIVIAGGAVMN